MSVFSLSVLHGDFNGENVNIQSSLISSIWSDLEISSYAHWVSLKKTGGPGVPDGPSGPGGPDGSGEPGGPYGPSGPDGPDGPGSTSCRFCPLCFF